jgi:hypothetical protein
MYIVLSVTMGAASCPRVMPVEKAKLSFKPATLRASISLRVLNRVLAKSPAGVGHWSDCSALPARGAISTRSATQANPSAAGIDRKCIENQPSAEAAPKGKQTPFQGFTVPATFQRSRAARAERQHGRCEYWHLAGSSRPLLTLENRLGDLPRCSALQPR